MEALKAASLALAREALVAPRDFRSTSKELVARLERVLEILKSVPTTSITASVAEYVYFPIHSLLQQSELGLYPTELVLRILTILVSVAWRPKGVFTLHQAQQLTAVVTYLISPEPPSSAQENPLNPGQAFFKRPSSLHAAGFECLGAIFQSAASGGFGPELGRAPTMAHIIAILLAGIQYDTSDVESQRQAIRALTTLLQEVVVNPDHRALILPRVTSKLAKFLAPSNKKHYSAKMVALECLRTLLVGCLGDRTFSSGDPSRVRTSQWLESTAEPLAQTIQIVKSLLVSVETNQTTHPELIASLFQFASVLYSQCFSTFKQNEGACIELLLEMIVLCASQSINIEINNMADAFLRHSEGVPKLLEGEVAKQTESLPSIIQSPDEAKPLSLLKSLKKSVTIVSTLEAHHAVLDSIVTSMPLTVAKTSLISPPLGSLVTSVASYQGSPNRMIRLSDLGLALPLSNDTQDMIYDVIAELSRTNGLELLGRLNDRLVSLKVRGQGSLDGTLVLWCAAAIVRNAPKNSDLYDVVAYCFEDIAASMDVQSSATGNGSPARAAHTALCCYVIGEVALNQGDAFADNLVDIIHPMFSMLGDSESISIRTQAQYAIAKISYACGYNSPAALALDNKDYLVDGISTQLNTMNFTPGTPAVLASLIYISGSDIIPYLGDLFTSLFVLLDYYHGYSNLTKGILSVFSALIHVIEKSFSSNGLKEIDQPSPSPSAGNTFIQTFDDLIAELAHQPVVDPSLTDEQLDLDQLASERIRELDIDEVPDSNDEEPSDDQRSNMSDSDDEELKDMAEQAVEDWNLPIAKPVYATVAQIAKYCDKLMTHDSPEIRLSVLSLFTKLTPYLALSKEDFLPLVHKTWPEAISRVFDPEIFVVEAGFDCLSAIASHAKDFVSTRVDELWPKLLPAFGPLFTRRWPRFSNERKSQDALINFLSATFDALPDVSLVTMESILNTVRPALLRREFPLLLEKLTTGDIGSNVKDMAWIVLMQEPVVPTQEAYHTIVPIYKN